MIGWLSNKEIKEILRVGSILSLHFEIAGIFFFSVLPYSLSLTPTHIMCIYILYFLLTMLLISYLTYSTFNHLADAFIQSDLQMRIIEVIKTNKRATTCKFYDKSQLA